MPYALFEKGKAAPPKDGAEPGSRHVASPSEASPFEAVVPDAPPGWVWEAAANRLRPRTDAEKLAKDREEAASREGLASAATALRASANLEIRALVVVLERAGVL